MENKQRLPGFVGPSYQMRAGRFDDQRCVNMYLEMDETGSGKGGEPAAMLGTPGLRTLNHMGTGPIRCTYTLSNQQVTYVVSGNELYQISGANAVPVKIVGNLQTQTGPVAMADNGIEAMFIDGQFAYGVTIGELTFDQLISDNFYPADTITFQDGYFVLNQTGTQNMFISDLYALTFPTLNTAAKTGSSDILIGVISNNRQLYMLGAHTSEIWFDSGDSGITPFVYQAGKFWQIGCQAPATIQTLGNTFLWLGGNAQGAGMVYMMENEQPVRISTHAIEYALQQLGDISGSTAYCYQQDGHNFYVLNPTGSKVTWVYDIVTSQWHERTSTINGFTGRHLGQTQAYLNGNQIIGDYQSGNIYEYDFDCYTDGIYPRQIMRQTPHQSASLNRIFYKLLEVDFQFGVGLPSDPISGSITGPLALFHYESETNIGEGLYTLNAVGDPTVTTVNQEVHDGQAFGIAAPPTPLFPASGNALKIGTGEEVLLPSFTTTGTNITVNFSIYVPTGTGDGLLLWTNRGTGDDEISVEVDTEGPTVLLDFNLPGVASTGINFSYDTWHQIAIEVNQTADTISFYCDGTRFDQVSAATWNFGDPTITWGGVWRNSSTNFGDGLFIDEYRVVDAAVYAGATSYTLPTAPFDVMTTPITNSPAVNPRVSLEISNDGGKTWGNPIYASLGKIGQYNHRARWQRLGYARDRMFRVTVTDAVKVQMLSAMLDAEAGSA